MLPSPRASRFAAAASLVVVLGGCGRKRDIPPTPIAAPPSETTASASARSVAIREAAAPSTAPSSLEFARPENPAARSRIHGPCADCRASLPGGTDARPLLVLLHGDNETAEGVFEDWAAAAEARGIAVLAPACPRDEGCTERSWWKWNGNPSYLLEQVRALADAQWLDADRLWIFGWSGGASYIGYRTQEIERTFAAVVIHGGGIRPADPACAEPHASVYFLVGDANPLHSLAVQLRDYYVRCNHDVTWTLLKGADHQAERRALPAKRAMILDWLMTKRKRRQEAIAPDAGD